MNLHFIIVVPVMHEFGDSIEYLSVNFADYIVSGTIRINQAALAD